MKRLAAAVLVLLTACAGTPEADQQLISTTHMSVVEPSVAVKKDAYETSQEALDARRLFYSTIVWQNQVRENEEAARKAKAARDAARRKTYSAAVQESVPASSDKAWLSAGFMYRLAGCETGGKYDNPNTGNGYSGYFQMTDWAWENGGGEPGRKPHEFPYEHQAQVARVNIQKTSFSGQHPHCSGVMRREGYEVRS